MESDKEERESRKGNQVGLQEGPIPMARSDQKFGITGELPERRALRRTPRKKEKGQPDRGKKTRGTPPRHKKKRHASGQERAAKTGAKKIEREGETG